LRRLWSWLGAILAALYGAAMVYAYLDYLRNAGQFLGDLLLMIVALPFTWTMLHLAGNYAFSGDQTGRVIGAGVFCCALAYGVGLAIESALRGLYRLARRRPG
jgi:hypothetical protein